MVVVSNHWRSSGLVSHSIIMHVFLLRGSSILYNPGPRRYVRDRKRVVEMGIVPSHVTLDGPSRRSRGHGDRTFVPPGKKTKTYHHLFMVAPTRSMLIGENDSNLTKGSFWFYFWHYIVILRRTPCYHCLGFTLPWRTPPECNYNITEPIPASSHCSGLLIFPNQTDPLHYFFRGREM